MGAYAPLRKDSFMWQKRKVTIEVVLPETVADQCEGEMATQDGRGFLSQVVLYGLTRRSIHRHLREQREKADETGEPQGLLI